MDDQAAMLKEWIISYVKNKDVYLRSIRKIVDKDCMINVEYKDKKTLFFIMPLLEDIHKIAGLCADEGRGLSVITLNAEKNLDFVIKNWVLLSKNPLLYFFFVNPGSQTDKRWIICPYVHCKVADDDSLRSGLKALFDTVDPVQS